MWWRSALTSRVNRYAKITTQKLYNVQVSYICTVVIDVYASTWHLLQV